VVFKRDFFRRVRVEHRVLRGGAWNSNVASMRPTYRRHADPDKVSDVQGFRCVFAAP
jgi:formylglycine-generating enzyme required for sulfatase activity